MNDILEEEEKKEEKEERKNLKELIIRDVNDSSHRGSLPVKVEVPEDVLLEATPLQKEKIVFLVNDAIDTVESIMLNGSENNRLKAAQDILDRAGLKQKESKHSEETGPAIPTEGVVAIVQGMMNMFGQSGFNSEDVRVVRPVFEEGKIHKDKRESRENRENKEKSSSERKPKKESSSLGLPLSVVSRTGATK